MTKTRNFEGFGVITRQGRFLWQYCRPTKEATQEAYERHNPQVTDHEDGYKIVPLKLTF